MANGLHQILLNCDAVDIYLTWLKYMAGCTLKSTVGVTSPPSNNYQYILRNLFMLVDDIF